jgi:hypothetical protein
MATLRVVLVIAAALALAGSTGPAARAQSSHCDPYLPVSKDNPLGYRLRGDRCEGVYVQQVTNTPVLVASFGRLNLPALQSRDTSVLVEWAPVAEELRLRTYSLKPRTYYRMDSRRPPGGGSYRWSSDVVAALELAAADVGIVAWTERDIGGARHDVYLPVRAGSPPVPWDGVYELVIVPGTELNEVFVGVSAVGADGAPGAGVIKPAALKYGYYPAGRPIRIPIGPLPSSGTFIAEIGATLKAGGALSHDVWFVHDGAPRR